MKSSLQRRPGFTLIELLVVIAIISLLMAITVSAVFRLKQSSAEKNTVIAVRKIDIGYRQQWEAALDNARKEPIPPEIMAGTVSANGQPDPVRARALHMKLRMRQEFPQNFGELYSPPPAQFFGTSYSTKPIYAAATAGLSTTVNPENQNAAMLYIIMSQGRGGVTFGNDNASRTALIDFPLANGGAPRQLRGFVDEWATPIGHRREADDDILYVLQELNQPPFVNAAQLASGNCDSMDPEGRLKIQGWPLYAKAFAYLGQPNPANRPFILNPFDGKNRGPYVFSAGRDMQYYPPNEQDNIYSYRIQQTNRGN